MGYASEFYVTTPIYYVNDRPHLGHAYTTLMADIVARYHRLRGDDTFFLTGVDEHAAKVSEMAAKQGMPVQDWADQNARAFQAIFHRIQITNDDFVRTSEDRHKRCVERYVKALLDSGDVYQGRYEGWYDAGQEEYVPENKAKQNSFKSEITGKPLVRKVEKNYFFRLSSYRERLLDFYKERDANGMPFVQPEARKNEVINRIREMEDIPISRSGSRGWGIPVPGDPEQTVYVWIDALFNYLTYMDTTSRERRKYWKCGALQFIAKDILWFHAAVWPSLLMALQRCADYQWVNLPKQVYSHSFWISDSGEKMSKSLGNFLDPETIDNYINEFGLDALRYFLATRGPLGVSDSVFSRDLFIEVYNSDLANTFGNSCSRVTNMVSRYFGGTLPGPLPDGHKDAVPLVTNDWTAAYEQHFAAISLAQAAEVPLLLVRDVDAYIETTRPYRMAKEQGSLPAVGDVLYRCLEKLRIASIMLWPFLPNACERFWRRIGCQRYGHALAAKGRGDFEGWTQRDELEPGVPIKSGEPLFPRYEQRASRDSS